MPSHKRYIFVGGMPRSGTTLLYAWLCTDPTANPHLEEAPLLEILFSLFGQQHQYFEDLSAHFWKDREELENFFRVYVQLFLSQLQKMYPKADTIIIKRPFLADYFPMIDSLLGQYEEIKYVVCVRDPKDTCASYIKAQERVKADPKPWEKPYGRDVQAWCAALNRTYLPYFQENPLPEKLIIVRYEDLIKHSQHAFTSLEEFLDLRIDVSNPWKKSDSFMKKLRSSWRSDVWNKPVTTERISNYGSVLTDGEIWTIDVLCKRYIERFGYTFNWQKIEPGLRT